MAGYPLNEFMPYLLVLQPSLNPALGSALVQPFFVTVLLLWIQLSLCLLANYSLDSIPYYGRERQSVPKKHHVFTPFSEESRCLTIALPQ